MESVEYHDEMMSAGPLSVRWARLNGLLVVPVDDIVEALTSCYHDEAGFWAAVEAVRIAGRAAVAS